MISTTAEFNYSMNSTTAEFNYSGISTTAEFNYSRIQLQRDSTSEVWSDARARDARSSAEFLSYMFAGTCPWTEACMPEPVLDDMYVPGGM